MSGATLNVDWTSTVESVVGTNFTLNIQIDQQGIFSLASAENIPATMQFTATGATGLSALYGKSFSLNFSSVNGQNFESHGLAGSYRVGMTGGANKWRFDLPTEVARITADLSGIGANQTLRLHSMQYLNSVAGTVTNYVVGLRDSSGVEVLSATNANGSGTIVLADIAPLLAGGATGFFEFRAASGSAGGWGNLVFEFQSNQPTNGTPIHPANIFTSGCVLQRGRAVAVWGSCEPGETITLEIKNQSKTMIADGNGAWRINLDPEPAGGPFPMVISGANSAPNVLTDVYFGDVWILTGQSNMFQPLGGQVANFPHDYPAVPDATDDFDDVRFAIVDTISASNAPADDVVMAQPWGRWQADRLADMSAVGYFFARYLNEKLDANGMGNVPLGVIKVCKGGTSIEQWISAEELNAVKAEDGSVILAANASGYYNGMIAPIQDYAIKGALWYQGEGNAASIARISQYPRLKQALVESWRTQWNNPDMPFYYVQLAPYNAYSPIPNDELWAWMRESQTACLAITNTGMACIIDGGLQGNIHPPFKDRAGERLARMALSNTYGISSVSSGPTFADCQFTDADAVVTMDHVAGGLRTQAVDSQLDADEITAGYPAVSVSSNELAGFSLCGSDQIFYWATAAEIMGSNLVRVSSTDVPNPVAVRYAWQNYPRCNLFSSEGLPSEPFRTDNYGYLTSSGAMHTVPTSTIVYQDDFSGSVGPASGTVPEVSLAGFQDISIILRKAVKHDKITQVAAYKHVALYSRLTHWVRRPKY